ncbi:2TM domain-containing protein [Rufibacter sp. LB8]|uniref:2TM domain-containing protein n=2 Tax=Rufibacter sp. LB8 TaxID=2777781 RepID=UPI00178C60F7|nr:2TM domain-containing protein [Rufibacter sp. LB8]
MEMEKDKTLWRIAKKRVGFKRHLFTYAVVNLFLWAVWYFNKDWGNQNAGVPWPVWGTFGWGMAVLFSYFDAYHSHGEDATEREYAKLTNKKNS